MSAIIRIMDKDGKPKYEAVAEWVNNMLPAVIRVGDKLYYQRQGVYGDMSDYYEVPEVVISKQL